MPKIKLFCIPFAGGTSLFYANWKVALKQEAEVIPVELPGKGLRKKEFIAMNFRQAAEDIYNTISQNVLEGEPYGIYGHSMGALLLYELCYLFENRGKAPKFVVFSGVPLPYNFSCEEVPYHDTRKLGDYVMKLGGIPASIKKSFPIYQEIMNTVREDYKILATYQYEEHDVKISGTGYIINGKEDSLVNGMETKSWGRYFDRPVRSFLLPGGHFFINEYFTALMNILKGICSGRY